MWRHRKKGWPRWRGEENAIARHDGRESGQGGAGDDWSVLMRSGELNPWMAKLKESNDLPPFPRLKTASGGSRCWAHGDSAKSRKKQCNWWCAASTTGGTRTESLLYRTVSGSRTTAGCVQEPLVCSEVAGQSASGRGQLGGHDLRRFAGRAVSESRMSQEDSSRETSGRR